LIQWNNNDIRKKYNTKKQTITINQYKTFPERIHLNTKSLKKLKGKKDYGHPAVLHRTIHIALNRSFMNA
ncbi:hypothetical protein, partial [Bacillus spizizenii]|uniref:hypothetical protein n=1 Tax=Bacillus spizizenii TaxID=96241 RepID=UPI001F616809